MKKISAFLILALLLVACASETEQLSLTEIADLYGAKTSYSKSFDTTDADNTITSFNVKVSESVMIDSLQPTVTSGNIALLVYEGLTAEEKKDYTQIDVELVNLKQDTAAYTYPTQVLADLSVKASVYKNFSQALIDGNFEQVDAMKDDKEIPQSIAEGLKNQVNTMVGEHGSLVGYEPFGIAEASDAQGTIYQFQGQLIFNSGHKKLYLVGVDAAKGNDKLIGFRIF